MSATAYEVRGIKFFSEGDAMAIGHRCGFSIALRLSGGDYWVALYRFLDDSEYKRRSKDGDKETLIARNGGVPPSTLLSQEVWPKDVLAPQSQQIGRSRAKLKYIRTKGEKKVFIKMDVWAKTLQLVQFNMTEPAPATADEKIDMEGKVSPVFLGRDESTLQILGGSPWLTGRFLTSEVDPSA
jgi:hypothetical protein